MDKVGRYNIIRELGEGGMANVFLAWDPTFERQVAVKLMPGQLARDRQFRKRFLREAKLVAGIEHPCIVPVYDYGQENDHPYIVMRYMPGGTLADRIAGHPMGLAAALPVIERVAAALDAAHRRGIVHRDLKPSNILFDDEGHAFLSDFGLAKTATEGSKLTVTGVMVGTPDYMSPEQALGELELDGRSDVYAFGIVIYEMLTGHVPHQAASPMKVLYKHMTEPPPPLNEALLQLPRGTNAALAKSMAKTTVERFATAGEMAAALRGLIGGKPTPIPDAQALAPGNSSPPPPALIHPTVEVTRPAPRSGLTVAGRRISTEMAAMIAIVALGIIGVSVMTAFIMSGVAGGVPVVATQAPTLTPSLTATATATPTTTSTPTFTATATVTPTATESATATATDTPTSPPPTNTRIPTRPPPTATRPPPTPTTAPTATSTTQPPPPPTATDIPVTP